MKLMVKDLELEVNEQNGGLTIRQGRTVWKFREEGRARLECREGTLLFGGMRGQSRGNHFRSR